ncbi:MAG: glycine cleavage system protein GcvH [Planctomycetes bacterium]|nr:glycine cleavage system protein GcvH [Planctomycetota bacterium]MBL7106721.1 glycine cleavage system protein GcvH [Phycisphaerae bacterium]
MIKKDLLYTSEHEWARVEGDIVTVGITDHAQELLGELTYVELPEVGAEVKIGDEIGVVESSKSASDVYSPAEGKIIEVNDSLEDNPEQINEECYGEGWICKIQISGKESVKGLMSGEEYEEFLVGI